MNYKLTTNYDDYFNSSINHFLIVLQNWVNDDVKQDSLVHTLCQNKFILYIKSMKRGFKITISYSMVDKDDVFINTKSISKFESKKQLQEFLQQNYLIEPKIILKLPMDYLIDKRKNFVLLTIKIQPKQFYTVNQLHYLKVVNDEYKQSLKYVETNFNNLRHEDSLNMLVIKVNTEGLQKELFQPCYVNFLIKYRDVKIKRGVIKLNNGKVLEDKMFYKMNAFKVYTLNEFVQYIRFLHKNLPIDIALINNRMSLHDYYIISYLQAQLKVSELYYGITPPTGVYKGIGLEVEKPARLHIIKPGSIEFILQKDSIQKIVLKEFSYFNHLITQEIDVQELLKRDIIDESYNARSIVMNNLEYQICDLNICYKGYKVLRYNNKSFKVQDIVTTEFLKSMIYYLNNNIQNYPIIIEDKDNDNNNKSYVDYKLIDDELRFDIKEDDNKIMISIEIDRQNIY